MCAQPLGWIKRIASLALIGTLAFAATQRAVAAADGQLDVRAALGFSDTFRLGHWSPLTVTVSNHGAALQGELQVRLTYGRELNEDLFTKTHRRRFDLSRGSRKRFRFTVFVESFAFPLEVRVVAGGETIAVQRIDLRQRFTESRLVLALTRDANLDYLNDSFGQRLRVVYPHPELLPDHWLGYDGVAALIVHGVSLEDLSPRQFSALKKWLAQGGRLAVSGGPDYSLLRTSRLAELLPASPTGLAAVTDAASVGDALGHELEARAPFHVHQLNAYRGRTVYRAGDLPLVVEEASGRGIVAYLSFDVASPPFDRWPPMKTLWLALLRLPAEPAAPALVERRRHSVVTQLIDQPAYGFPGHTIVVLLLVLYLGMLVTLYRLQPLSRRGRRLLPALIVACPLAFAVAFYSLFASLLFPMGATAIVASVIEPFPAGPFAKLRADLGLFANRRQPLWLDIEAPDPGLLASAREDRWGKTASYSVQNNSGVRVNVERSRAYTLHLLQAEDIIAYDAKAAAARTSGGVRLMVHNRAGHDWEDAWLIAHRTVYRLGRIAHNDGQPVTRNATVPHYRFEDASDLQLGLRTAAERERGQRLRSTLLATALKDRVAALRTDEALLAAIAPSPMRLGQTGALHQQEATAIVLIRLDIGGAERGDAAR